MTTPPISPRTLRVSASVANAASNARAENSGPTSGLRAASMLSISTNKFEGKAEAEAYYQKFSQAFLDLYDYASTHRPGNVDNIPSPLPYIISYVKATIKVAGALSNPLELGANVCLAGADHLQQTTLNETLTTLSEIISRVA